MERYIDEGHVLLSIGRGQRWGSRVKMLPYLDRVFNLAEKRGVLLHGFAVTDVELMMRFPWYSVDSSSWLQVRNVGHVMVVRDGRLLSSIRVTDGTGGDLEWVASIMKEHGFDLAPMRHRDKERRHRAFMERGVWNMFVLENLWELGVRPSSGGGGRKWGSLLG